MLLSSQNRPSRGWIPLSLVVIALSTLQPARAAIYVVGADAGCTHATLQAAINAAEANAGADTVRVTRSASYVQQALVLTTAQQVELVGGFATCSQATSDGILTLVNGAGGVTEPVMRITVSTGGVVSLRHLTLSGGDEEDLGYGGGIFFRGDGSLQISNSIIRSNVAGYGGGIYAEGTGTNAELIIGANVTISSNTARYSGGGIFVDGIKMSMREQDSVIAFNTANGGAGSGFGGGLVLRSRDNLHAHALIGGGGSDDGFGTIFGNRARYGGGVAIIGGDGADADAQLDLYTSQADRRTVIRQNVATVAGGGLYVQTALSVGPPLLFADSSAYVWNADIVGNSAPEGAASHLSQSQVGAGLFVNDFGNAPVGAVSCPIDQPCGSITGNRAQMEDGQPTSGAVIFNGTGFVGLNRNSLSRGGVLISGNRGGRVLVGGALSMRNVLIVDNEVGQQLLRSRSNGTILIDSTVAGNTIGAAQVLEVEDSISLRGSIIWQPGKTSLTQIGGDRTVHSSIASEVNSLGGAPGAIIAAPRFLDPARGDYRLRAASPAVDFAPAVDGNDGDAHGLPRDQRIPEVFRAFPLLTRDVGAHERPALQPLVLNSDLDVDLNLWSPVTTNAATWDNTQNAPGSAGGSIRVSLSNIPQPRIVAMTQCLHLPGPGVYSLNGWGRSGFGTPAERDVMILSWEFRNNGTEACNAGPATMSGDHVLTTAASWGSPPPSLIDIRREQWSPLSSISISLVVVDRGLTLPGSVLGWFDRITLTVDASGELFANGFEQ